MVSIYNKHQQGDSNNLHHISCSHLHEKNDTHKLTSYSQYSLALSGLIKTLNIRHNCLRKYQLSTSTFTVKRTRHGFCSPNVPNDYDTKHFTKGVIKQTMDGNHESTA